MHKKKIVMCIGLAGVFVTLLAGITLNQVDESKSVKDSASSSNIEVETRVYDLDKADKEEVEIGEKVKVSKETFHNLEDLKLNIADTIGRAEEVAYTLDDEDRVHATLDWSDRNISDEELVSVRCMAAQAYQNRLNYAKKKDRYVVIVGNTTPEDMNKFQVPVFWYVAEDGALYVQLRLEVYDKEEQTLEERLVPVGLKYVEGSDEVTMIS